jgi:hypothetical protein
MLALSPCQSKPSTIKNLSRSRRLKKSFHSTEAVETVTIGPLLLTLVSLHPTPARHSIDLVVLL